MVAAAHNGRQVQAKRRAAQEAAAAASGGSGTGGAVPLVLLVPAPPRTAAPPASSLGASLTLPLESRLLPASRAALCVGLDPLAALLGALRARFGGAAAFHADAEPGGGAYVGVAWRGAPGPAEEAGAGEEAEAEGGGAQLLRRLALLQAAVGAGAGLVRHAEVLPPPCHRGRGGRG